MARTPYRTPASQGSPPAAPAAASGASEDKELLPILAFVWITGLIALIADAAQHDTFGPAMTFVLLALALIPVLAAGGMLALVGPRRREPEAPPFPPPEEPGEPPVNTSL